MLGPAVRRPPMFRRAVKEAPLPNGDYAIVKPGHMKRKKAVATARSTDSCTPIVKRLRNSDENKITIEGKQLDRFYRTLQIFTRTFILVRLYSRWGDTRKVKASLIAMRVDVTNIRVIQKIIVNDICVGLLRVHTSATFS